MRNMMDIFEIDENKLRERLIRFMKCKVMSAHKVSLASNISYNTVTSFLHGTNSKSFTTLSSLDSYLNRHDCTNDSRECGRN